MRILRSKIFLTALKVVLDWYCHNNDPFPQWWYETGPYNIIVKELENILADGS